MGIQALTLMDAATSCSVTGGASKTYSPDGQTVVNGMHVADGAETDFRVRKQITFRTRNPQRQSDGSFSKGKRWITLYCPYLKANGTVAPNVERYESEVDPETPAANAINNRKLMSQLLFDADVESFHTSGSLS